MHLILIIIMAWPFAALIAAPLIGMAIRTGAREIPSVPDAAEREAQP